MRQLNRRLVTTLVFAFLATSLIAPTIGQEVASAKATSSSLEELRNKAKRIATTYEQLEQLMLRMAEIEALTNPQRASLLKRAAQQSAERRTKKQLDTTVSLLIPPAKLKRAIDEQERGLADMQALLELLMSEDRADRLKVEEQRIRDYIKEVDRLIRLQRSTEGRTRGGADPAKLANEQDRIAGRTGNLAQEIRETEEGGSDNKSSNESPEAKQQDSDNPKPDSNDENQDNPKQSGDPKQGDPKQGDPKQGDPKQGDPKQGDPKQGDPKQGDPKQGDPKQGDPKQGDPKQGDPKQGDPKQGDPKQGDPKQGESQQGESQQSQSDSGEQQPQDDQQANPARKRLEAAEQRMREAKKRLEEAKRDEAVEEQEKARHELEKAKAELEEILRQMREEEVGRTLAMLEGRFRRMLEKQMEVFESTKRLDKIAIDERGRQVDIQASKLGFDETKLAVEADKALLLLHEEGSSVAFPETVSMMRDDMQEVADLLASTKVGAFTQDIEEEIITTLEEMIAALQQAQQDLEEKQQQQQQQGQPQQPGEEPLVDQIAEIKMIRALQMRINTRTNRYSKLLEDSDDVVGQADDQQLRDSLFELGQRQNRVYEITRDIELGRNK